MKTSLEHLEKLIAFPSVSRDSNLDLIAYVRGFLSGLGIESLLVHNEDGRKANLWATIGPKHVSGIVLSGHTDVVPVGDEANWKHEPFAAEIKDGLLYGRGATDMKGSVAAFAAGVGGADAVTVVPFDEPLGVPDALGRRVARNTSSLLIEESHVAAVADPAGGSYAVEKLTDDLAAAVAAKDERIAELTPKAEALAAVKSDLAADDAAAALAKIAEAEKPGRMKEREKLLAEKARIEAELEKASSAVVAEEDIPIKK